MNPKYIIILVAIAFFIPLTAKAQTTDNCQMVNDSLPDRSCTPGATNPDVTQSNIQDTICKHGYTATIRPPTSFTEPLKIQLMQSYHQTGNPHSYELDHLIPLEVGGNPTSTQNLWPEPGWGQYSFHVKDRFENWIREQVCSDKMTLAEGQNQLSNNWVQNWIDDGMPAFRITPEIQP